jgi:hypothetical protein
VPTFGAYYSGYKTSEREQRLKDIPVLAAYGFDRLASPFSAADPNCLKAAQLCRDKGMKVLLQPNALQPNQFASAGYAGLANVDWIDVWDDAHTAKPEDIAAKRDQWAAVIGPNRLTSITCARNTDVKYVNICPVFAAQYYSWKEGNWLIKNYWEDVKRLVAASTGRVVATHWLGMNAVPWSLKDQPDWKTKDREYTPVAQQEVAMWMALCAGASDLLFYTAYEYPAPGDLALESGRSYIIERPIWLEQYKAAFAYIRKHERYFAGVRALLPGNAIGAQWTLPDGSGIKVTFDLESEVLPRFRVDPFQPPVPPPPPAQARVLVTSDGQTINFQQLP